MISARIAEQDYIKASFDVTASKWRESKSGSCIEVGLRGGSAVLWLQVQTVEQRQMKAYCSEHWTLWQTVDPATRRWKHESWIHRHYAILRASLLLVQLRYVRHNSRGRLPSIQKSADTDRVAEPIIGSPLNWRHVKIYYYSCMCIVNIIFLE